MGAAPRQPGADTDAVLADFGFSEAEIARLRDAGVVGAA
jgi:crotonobetainyl-CoA:carnitine CoA-transferase CaiB-like acyl-CoA transferase